MNLPAGDLTVRGPGIECPWFDSQLFSEVFDRQQHTDTHRGSLPTPPSPLCARVSTPASPWVAATVPPSIGPAFLQPSRPARCNAPRAATRIRPCPGRWWGAGNPWSVIGRGPSVGLCPSAPHTAGGAPAPSPSNSAPWPSAREAAPTPSRRTRARLLQWPSRLMRR